MADKVQNFENHGQIVPMYHYVSFGLLAATLVGSCVNLFTVDAAGHYSAALLVATNIVLVFVFFWARLFALKAQDRAIRAEENFRHFILTGKPLDKGLDTRQIIGLRFSSDDEFPALAQRALAEKMSEKDIKRAVKNWRADHYRA